MRRAQIQLDEEVYELLRRRAFKEKESVAGVIREIIGQEIAVSRGARIPTIRSFKFIGVGRSKQSSGKAVSERHDQALAEVFGK